MKHMRRFLAVLLCLLMVTALLPTTALAIDQPYEDGSQGDTDESWGCNHMETVYHIEATCTSAGISRGVCEWCGKTLWTRQSQDPLGHYAGPYNRILEPTCTTPGSDEQYCNRCGLLLWTREVPAMDHEMGQWVRVKEPSGDEPGLEERNCIRGDLTETRKVHADGTVDVQVNIVFHPTTTTVVDIPPQNNPEPSEPNTVPTEPNPVLSAALVKYLSSGPANGMFFTPGETIDYTLVLYNTGDTTIAQANLVDPLGGAVPVSGCADLEPGASFQAVFSYTVTEADAAAGSVSNQAYAECGGADGQIITVVSNTVAAPAGSDPFGVISGLSISKTETSAPANGSYYQAGETITYAITVENYGETDLGETIVYDILKPGSGEIASAEMLHSGESRSYSISYTVTQADVADGYVINYAFAYYDNAGYSESAISNVVISDTDGKPDIGGIPGSFSGPIKLSDEGEGYTSCVMELTGHGDTGTEYEIRWCPIHEETRKTIDTMLMGAKTDAARLKAWKFAGSMWMTEVDTLYDALLEVADPVAARFVQYEQNKFRSMCTRYEALLTRLGADETQIAMTLAELARNKSVEMCCELHAAPSARIDSLSHTANGFEGVECKSCFRAQTEEEDGSVVCTLQLCPDHAVTAQMRDALLEMEQQWPTIRTLWQMELQSGEAIVRAGLDADGKSAADTDARAFRDWLEARQMILQILYPGDEATQLEVVSFAIQNRVMELCEYSKR